MATATKKRGQKPERRRLGRPSKLTYDLADRIIGLIEAGNYVETAARAVGVSKQRFYDWDAKGAEYDDADQETLDSLDEEAYLYVYFRDAYQRAQATAEVDLLAEARAAGTHWHAAMTILERRWPARFRRRDEVEHSGEVGARVVLSPEQTREEIDSWAKAGRGVAAVAAGPDSVEPPADA